MRTRPWRSRRSRSSFRAHGARRLVALGRSRRPRRAGVMEHAVALMREHVHPTARLHRMVEVGGQAFNVISEICPRPLRRPGRHPGLRGGDGGPCERIASGAALASETRAKVTPLSARGESWYAPALQELMRRALEVAGRRVSTQPTKHWQSHYRRRSASRRRE